MQNLKNQRAIVTGGSSGLGLGVVESLVARGAKVMVVARDAQRLAEVENRLGVVGAVGDVADRALATALLQEFRPTVLVLNAGAKPAMGPLHEQSWEGFQRPLEQRRQEPASTGSRRRSACRWRAAAGC